jgi:ATP-binding cassette subfamily C (CFTR/MRP) protein 1
MNELVFGILAEKFGFLIFFWVGLQHYYMKSAREVARLMGVEKAPILNHYSESIAGAVTIRSFVQQQQFMAMNIHLFDNYSRPCFANIALVEWIMFRMEFLCNLVFSLLMVIVLLLPDGVVSPSML